MNVKLETITSKDNSRLKLARAVRDGREREFVFVEGLRLVEEARASLAVHSFFVTPEFVENARGAKLIENLAGAGGFEVSAKLLESIADTKSPQGIVLIAAKPATGREIIDERVENQKRLWLILHELNNPANTGAILRAAEAAGANGVILTEKCADVFQPKSLRAAMGSAFRLPLWTDVAFAEAIEFCRARQIKIAASAAACEKTLFDFDWIVDCALVVGSEARGLSADEIALCDESLRIPMNAPVESLNAAVAAGVFLYEARRQRG